MCISCDAGGDQGCGFWRSKDEAPVRRTAQEGGRGDDSGLLLYTQL